MPFIHEGFKREEKVKVNSTDIHVLNIAYSHYPFDKYGFNRVYRDHVETCLDPALFVLLYGDTATRYQLWDAMRSLDYLTSHPAVDPKRVASTGHSGGGTLTMSAGGGGNGFARGIDQDYQRGHNQKQRYAQSAEQGCTIGREAHLYA